MVVNLITKNPGKILAAKNIFAKYGIRVRQLDLEFPEIQADTSLEIARYTATQASKKLSIPVIREDHSLFINALGIPGPYTNFIEKHLPVNKLLEVLKSQKDRGGYFEIATVYAEPNGLVLEYIYQVPVFFEKKIRVPDPRGGWNGIIRLVNESRTLTEYPEEERLHIWSKNYLALAKYLTKNKS